MFIMKKILVLFAAVAFTVVTYAHSPIVENEVVTAAFQKQFSTASDVSWSQKNDLYLVSFKYNNDRMLAWYRPDGTVEAVQRSVQVDQMTFLAASAVQGLSKDKNLLTAAEVSKEGELFYLIKIEDEKCISVYKISAAGDYSRIEKVKKRKS
jgi:hypothetical protein